jgi:ABC-type multidrug transport system fused ATPase/permease subunit
MTHSINLKNLHFNYNSKTTVFNDHFMDLTVQESRDNKLYGIIGPSGTGKTTLISILGGQLKPDGGQVLIDQVDVYGVNDSLRKDLIAMQLQTATSLRGELRYNLLYGLPNEKQYEDDYLIQILKNVGLWEIFSEKDGLQTLIGEGGLNLSGGQRQRLNFAGLYLRAKYYRPTLILIDEPTSSLDEISEKAITKMINDLGKIAVTMVVAHRLKTLDDTVGIMDSSLLKDEKEMQFYDRRTLREKSHYYRDLMEGKAELEE